MEEIVEDNKKIGIILGARFQPRQGIDSIDGCIITFLTSVNIQYYAYVMIELDKKKHWFIVSNLSTTNIKTVLKAEAHEVGRFAQKFEQQDDFDLRSLIDVDVKLVTDRKTIEKVRKDSKWL